MRAADDHRARAARERHVRCRVEGAQRDPRTRQSRAVPRLNRRAHAANDGLPRLGHGALVDLGQVGREQREAVRRVAEEIAVEENGSDVVSDVVAHAGAREQGVRERREIVGAIAGGLAWHG